MKKIIFVVLAAAGMLQANAAEPVWLTDLPAAQVQAKTENKIVLMDFNGSDWCPGCIEFRKNVLVTRQFIDYAEKNVVVVDVDFPDKKVQPKALKAANAALSDKYKVNGYPTLVVLDQSGKEIGREEGYDGEDAKAFIKALEKFRGK